MNKSTIWRLPPLAVLLCAVLLFAACEDDAPPQNTASKTPKLDMEFPASLSGTAPAGGTTLTSAPGVNTRTNHGEPHCFFEGAGNNDPFLNGYFMTRFLVGVIAEWMCLTDFIINTVVNFPIPNDGSIFVIAPDPNDPEKPTGVSITADSATQTTVRLFFGGNITAPGLYVSWNTNGGSTQGKLVLTDGFINNASNPNPGAPNAMRMDFTITGATQFADMFLTFPSTHPNVKGFRIQVTKNLDTAVYPTFTALGRLDMSVQSDPKYVAGFSGATIPSLLMYTVSDVNGNGAAIASFTDVGISVNLGSIFLGHLGHYLFTKDDKYVFNDQLQAEWIDKNFTVATFQDDLARTSTVSPGNLLTIENALAASGLPASYFTGNCNTTGDNCNVLFNALFAKGTYGHEGNTGSDPGDQRTAIINAIGPGDYLQTVCADGAAAPCPSTMFDQSFAPTN